METRGRGGGDFTSAVRFIHIFSNSNVLCHITQTPDTPGYDCGYLVLIGEKEKVEKIADTTAENPYYYKLEEHDEVKKTADTTEENPYYYKLEQSIEWSNRRQEVTYQMTKDLF